MKRLAIAAVVVACRGATPPPEAAMLPDIAPLGSVPPAPDKPRGSETVIGGSLDEGDPVGQRAPGFDLPALTGKKRVALRRDRVTLVYFWATWCGPCTQALPRLGQLYTRLAPRGFDIAAISVDDETLGVKEFADKYGATFPVVHDNDHLLAKIYRVDTIPWHAIVDRDGVIRFVHAGYHDGEIETMRAEIEKLL